MLWTPGQPMTLTLDGVALEAAAWEPAADSAHGGRRPGAPLMVLLHEGLGCVAMWRGLPQALADTLGLPVFAYSRRGYGTSDPVPVPRPLDYMTREATEVLPGVLAAARAASGCTQVILLGHSDGGSIAALYAGSVTDLSVRGVILIAPHFFTEPGGLASIDQARVAYQTGDLRSRLAKYHRDVDGAFWGWNRAWLDPDFPRVFQIEDCLTFIRPPILALQGEDDQYGTRAQVDIVAELAWSPAEVVLIAGAAHSPHLQAPDPTLAAVSRFVERVLALEADPTRPLPPAEEASGSAPQDAQAGPGP